DDIPLLTEHFIAQFNQKFKKSVRGVEDDVLSLFMNYSWPGNIRELEHVIEHAFILCRDEVLTIGHLPQEFQERASAPSRLVAQDENEQEQIRQAMIRCGGNKAKAARLLGISRQTLYRKLEESPLDLDELP
ncbi:MAG: sigma-54-dependent Fis family transcriptional regulator, partial [Desulfuromonas sp.]